MKCKECKHWTRLKESDLYMAEDEIGKCCGLLLKDVDIEIIAGYEGGYIEAIETKHDFFCKNFNTELPDASSGE